MCLRARARACLLFLLLHAGCSEPAPQPGIPTLPASAGMTVYKDPVTGRFGTPPPGALPAPRARATAAPLPELVSPGGGSYILLDGRSQNYVTARVREDGTLETDCGEARP